MFTMAEKQEPQEEVYNTLDTISDADERELVALGKKPVLRVCLLFSSHLNLIQRRHLTLSPAQLFAIRDSRHVMHSHNNLGRTFQRLHLRTAEWRAGGANIWIFVLLGGMGSGSRDHE